MDPDKLLEEILAITTDILKNEVVISDEEMREKALSLAEKVDDMNSWLFSGGFIPKDWRPF